uniref:Uncharacterized protein n=1 Tax=Leersia perrieri TaxID=77586 RepID=A0A0D9WIP7_9ORYZ
MHPPRHVQEAVVASLRSISTQLRVSEMARLPLVVPIAFLLIFAAVFMAANSLSGRDDDGVIKIKMRYTSEEDARWIDSWAAKHQSVGGGDGDDFAVHPATAEESARLNQMAADAHKMGRGFDSHIEFDDDMPRFVVTGFPRSSKVNDDL